MNISAYSYHENVEGCFDAIWFSVTVVKFSDEIGVFGAFFSVTLV